MIQAAAQSVPIVPGSPQKLSPLGKQELVVSRCFSCKQWRASYIKGLQGPLGHIPLIPTGGVTLENAPEFFCCLGRSQSVFQVNYFLNS